MWSWILERQALEGLGRQDALDKERNALSD